MSTRLLICGTLLGLLATTAARADGFLIPGFGATEPVDGRRPSYREAQYPPPARDILGRPERPRVRPSYRQETAAFPPPAGQYGGGFVEYLMTGGRPAPAQAYQAQPYQAQPYQAQPAYGASPVYGSPQVYQAPPEAYAAPAYNTAPTYNPAAASLPRGGLPDYQPQPQAFFGTAPAAAYNAPTAADAATVSRQIDRMYYRQDVAYAGGERPGTIIIDTPEKFLFLVEPGGRALRYGIGVGRPGFTWAGVKTISRKAEWPAWTPPSEMLLRRPDLPRHMAGGIGNPLGARALYLGSSLYRIHGTNEPWTIGTNVSSGCIRMMNEDVEDIYARVRVGTRVIVL